MTAAPPAMPGRRGACPALTAPMPTGDGLLARLRPLQPLPPAALAGLAAAARSHGNGVVEVTARGSVQVRGLEAATAAPFAAAVAGLGITVEDGVAVIAGFDAVATALAAAVRRAIAAARLTLSPKVCVVVDGDGALHLDGVGADVRVRAAAGAAAVHVGVGNDTVVWLGTVAAGHAAAAVVGILATIAARGPGARYAAGDGVAALRAAAGVRPAAPPPPRPAADIVGVHAMADGTAALGVALAFGHTGAGALAALAERAGGCGVAAVRPAPSRALLFSGAPAHRLGDLRRAAADLGFVTDPRDPRRAIAACAGAPACASGLIAARRIAAELAPLLPAAAGVLVHVSGCAKGCAHPRPAALTLTGHPQGCAVIYRGTAAAAPDHVAAPAALGAEVAALLTAAAAAMEEAHG